MTVTTLHAKALAPGDRILVDARTWTVQAISNSFGLVALELVDRTETPGCYNPVPGIVTVFDRTDLVEVDRSQAPAH